jgi:thymidylate synthase (FAD)
MTATLKPIRTYEYLDKGFVELLNVNLTDTDLALVARSSFLAEEYDDPERNEKLVRYLINHAHTSPLEMASITVRIKMPIFVMRQHIRHRTARTNEQSLRYVVHDGDFYTPRFFRNQPANVKQGSGDEPISNNDEIITAWNDHNRKSYTLYLRMVESGVAREIARGVLGTCFYTTAVWQMDLSNLMKYMTLRSDSHAQMEIRELSGIFEEIVKQSFPIVYETWKEKFEARNG